MVQTAEATPSRHVLMIGIDGAGGQYVQQASTPHLDALASSGAARYDFLNEGALVPNPPESYGASGVNWTTFVTGTSAATHGVRDNSFVGKRLDLAPHWFQYVKQFDPQLFTASIVNWAPINDELVPEAYADLKQSFSGMSLQAEDALVREATIELLTTGNPHAVFLHFDQVDGAGHAFSWGSPQHLAAIEKVDLLIGDVVAAVNDRSGVLAGEEDWLILVSADHGAAPGSTGHVASQGTDNWETPLIISGPSVAPGTQLPQGTLRDLVPTALWHLGIDPFQTAVEGQVVGIPFGPPNGIAGDVNQDGRVSGDGTGPAASDDVTAFVAGWFTSGHTSVAAAYAAGDLNLDRRTDLADWILLHSLDPALARAAWRAIAVPEPSSLGGLALCGCGVVRRRRERRRTS